MTCTIFILYCGFQFFLQYWYYEYIRIPSPVLLQPVEDVFPRILRWAPEHQARVVGGVDHSLGACRRKLEEVTFYSVLWCPFATSVAIFAEADCLRALQISQFRFPLNINGIVSIGINC